VLKAGWYGFGAYDLSEGEYEFHANTAYVHHIPSTTGQDAAPLKWLTAVLAHVCARRIGREDHRVGGLRSGVGSLIGESSTSFKLNVRGYTDDPSRKG
jgi:hypothetical protein